MTRYLPVAAPLRTTLIALRLTTALALTASLGACASSASGGNHLVNEAAAAATPPKVIGADGPLTDAQSLAVLKKIGAEGPGGDALARHLAIEQAVAENPLVEGNGVAILKDGGETLRAMFAAMQGAKDHINLEYFIFDDVVSDGVKLGDLLVKKRQEGVAVNVIYDDFGSGATDNGFLDRLTKAGVQLVEYHPMNPLKAKGKYAPMNRDHRKILVVDGRLAIIGGVNLSATYESFSARKDKLPPPSTEEQEKSQNPQKAKTPVDPTETEYWRDDDLELQGPIVGHVQQAFVDQWEREKGAPLKKDNFFPKLPTAGKEIARVIGSTPDRAIPRYYVALLSAIRTARERIRITAAYFVPTKDLLEDLEHAAKRGVDVQLMLPDHSDSGLALADQHSHYEDLLEAGVKIYEIKGEVLHSKTAVVDGVWSVVGSSNLDRRSVLFNDEIDVVVLGLDTAGTLERMFQNDLHNARTITKEKWHRRPLFGRFEEMISKPWENSL